MKSALQFVLFQGLWFGAVLGATHGWPYLGPALLTAATQASDLRLTHLEDIGAHYVPTLAAWRANLRANWARARALGISEEQLRLFEFYFAYCEGGYAEGQLGNVQMRFARPAARRVRT